VSTAPLTTQIPELRHAVRQARADAFLVEPRVVRRIIRELHGYARLSTRVPHTEVLVVAAAFVRRLAHPDELGLDDFESLPDPAILVAQPEEHEFEERPIQDLLQLMWQRLFHGCIDFELQHKIQVNELTRPVVQRLIDQLGQVEFDEALAVLVSELRLINTASRVEAFCEFCAVYQQMAMFYPDLLRVWFPSFADTGSVLGVISEHVDAQRLFEDSRLTGAPVPDLTPGMANDETAVAKERESWTDGLSWKPSARRHQRLMRAHDRWSERGNTVAAAVSAMKASVAATSDEERAAARTQADTDMKTLASRLREALKFSERDLNDWEQSLGELLKNSVVGFWNSDKRLLYDLQKVCLDHERTIYQVDLVKWIVSRGKRPLRRPLTNIREVMMAKHLASCAGRLVSIRLSGGERARLSRLLHDAADLAEHQMRDRMRSTLRETINDVGLKPSSVPEQVALDKIVEESLDCITERGYLTMGYLRDAISRNDLKLPDLTDPQELIRGDHLLRTDDRLDVSLDGVYRRGEFYLRWLQVVSSLAFGWRAGRFFTLFMAIPFGGATIIVVGLEHLLHVLTARPQESAATTGDGTADDAPSPEPEGASGRDEGGEDVAANSLTAAPAESQPEATTSDGLESPAVAAVGATALQLNQPITVDETPVEDRTTASVEAHPFKPVYKFVQHQTVSLTLTVGLLLMALIHLPVVRSVCQAMVRQLWAGLRKVCFDLPRALLRLPIVQKIWRSRAVVWVRRHIVNPLLIVTACGWLLPTLIAPLFRIRPLEPLMIGVVSLLLSVLLNSRLGRDAEELTAEWLANVWYDVRSRFLMAFLDWIIDFFKWLLNLLERFIYAVDEWLRFHSGETWMSVAVKAVLGFVWSFVSFLLRIYVNLLIEPTLHPVKHFPVVTVAHKIFLPVILVIEHQMRETLTPYLGVALAGPITWFNIVFLPGIFGFLVWELKENWRLYASNRVPTIQPVVIGAHGENGRRLLVPAFHSGTLPKLFNRLRKIETKDASFARFSQRRALSESLEHVERDIRRFAERDLVRLLEYCSVWDGAAVRCEHVRAASNSFLVRLRCDTINDQPLDLLFQEQSGWLVATIADHGWLDAANPEMQCSFETALRGFYTKADVDLVREQLQRRIVGEFPYDVRPHGLVIWPERNFEQEISVDLHRRHQVRPVPASRAAQFGLQPMSREAVVFSERKILWREWQEVWATPTDSESATPLPLACVQSARTSLIKWRR